MKNGRPTLIALLLILIISPFLYSVQVDLRNLLSVDGLQDNPILGYGIVVGLKGTGDGEKGSQTREILSRIADHFGFEVPATDLKPRNCAVVLVSAVIPPFARPGSRIDVRVASVFDAKSVEGGELILTPLLGGDNAIYAVAQGSIQVDRMQKGVNGTVPSGAIVQKAVDHEIGKNGEVTVSVQETLGLGTVARVADAIRQKYPDAVRSVNANRITLAVPQDTEPFRFLDDVFRLRADVQEEPSVIIDSKSGILVSGGNLVVTEAAISFKGTRVSIGGDTANWGQSGSGKEEKSVQLLKASTTVSELVEGLNGIGAGPQDIIKILELLHQNGNLQGKLILQ
jgi:flagellar P-ring protein precursor FlgI